VCRPLAHGYAHTRANRIIDGPGEVHRWTVGRAAVLAQETHGTTASVCGGDLF
jgi:acyl-CoA dehydrogenase